MKASFEDVVKATGKNFECEQSISGYYRLVCDGKIILDDSACEDVNGTEKEAKDFFAEYLLEYEVPEDKKRIPLRIIFLEMIVIIISYRYEAEVLS